MPAEVEHLSYAHAANLRETGVPWWGTGTSAKETSYDHWLSDDEVKAEIGFDVDVKPLYRQNDQGLFVPVEDAQETVRVDWVDQFGNPIDIFDSAAAGPFRQAVHTHIATVGSDYTPFPGRDLVDLGTEIVQDSDSKWDTAGRLRGDRIIFATIRLDVLNERGSLVNFDNSAYYNWLLLATSHDGSMALQAAVVKYRTVCQNTYHAGLSTAKATFSVRHTRDIDGKAREAARVLGIVTKQDAEFNRIAEQLASSKFEVDEYEKLAEHLFPVTNDMGPRAVENRTKARDGVKRNWLQSPTIGEDTRFTKWGVLNGVTEWAEHKRPVVNRGAANERRMLSTLFGGPVQKLREQTVGYLIRPSAGQREVVAS